MIGGLMQWIQNDHFLANTLNFFKSSVPDLPLILNLFHNSWVKFQWIGAHHKLNYINIMQ